MNYKKLHKKRNNTHILQNVLSIALLLTCFLLTLSLVRAESVLGDDCAGAAALDAGSVVKCELETKMNIGSMTLINSDQFIMDSSREHTFNTNIDPESVKDLSKVMIYLASLMLVLVAVYTGYLFMYSAADPKKRNAAKRQLINLLIAGVAIFASFFIASLFFDLANEMSTTISSVSTMGVEEASTFFDLAPWNDIGNTTGGSVEETTNKFSNLLLPSGFLFAGGFLYAASMAARNVLIYAFFVFAPFVVLLFLFNPSRVIGKFFLVLIGVEYFIILLFAIIFRVSTLILSNMTLPSPEATAQAHIVVIAASLLLCAMLHIIIVLVVAISAGNEIKRVNA